MADTQASVFTTPSFWISLLAIVSAIALFIYISRVNGSLFEKATKQDDIIQTLNSNIKTLNDRISTQVMRINELEGALKKASKKDKKVMNKILFSIDDRISTLEELSADKPTRKKKAVKEAPAKKVSKVSIKESNDSDDSDNSDDSDDSEPEPKSKKNSSIQDLIS